MKATAVRLVCSTIFIHLSLVILILIRFSNFSVSFCLKGKAYLCYPIWEGGVLVSLTQLVWTMYNIGKV